MAIKSESLGGGLRVDPQIDPQIDLVAVAAGGSKPWPIVIREDIEGKIAALKTMRDTLNELIARCHGDGRPDCPLLADLAGHDDATDMDVEKSN